MVTDLQVRRLIHFGLLRAIWILPSGWYFEEFKSLPWSAVWDYYCMTQDVPV